MEAAVLVQSVKIKGANYRALDTKDGYFTVLDVPILSELKKDEKGVPQDIDKVYLEKLVSTAQEEYASGKFCGLVTLGHTDDFGQKDPPFIGYFLPKTVKLHRVGGEEKWTIFSDIKMGERWFQMALKAELPYHSPEILKWDAYRIDQLAFLNSRPPHFRYELFTVGEIAEDASARFDAHPRTRRFAMEIPPKDEEGEPGKKAIEAEGKGEGEAEAHCMHCEEHGKFMRYMASKLGISYEGEAKMAEEKTKPDAAPKELPKDAVPTTNAPGSPSARMDGMDDPKIAAKFAAQETRVKALEDRIKARDEADETASRVKRAEAELQGYLLGDEAKKSIVKFAAMGDESLAQFVAAFRESAQKVPARTLGEMEAAIAKDAEPTIAKFQAPEDKEKAARFAAEYTALKKRAPGYSLSLEQHVEMEMRRHAAAKEEGR